MLATNPMLLIAELSYKCPLHCPYCSNPLTIGDAKYSDELPTEDNGERYLLHPAHHPVAATTNWRELCIEQGQFEPRVAEQVSDSNEYTFGALFLERA